MSYVKHLLTSRSDFLIMLGIFSVKIAIVLQIDNQIFVECLFENEIFFFVSLCSYFSPSC